jgi:hypothetical protein
MTMNGLTPGFDLLCSLWSDEYRPQRVAQMTTRGPNKYITLKTEGEEQDIPVLDTHIEAHLHSKATYAAPLIGTDDQARALVIELDEDAIDGARQMLEVCDNAGLVAFSIACPGANGHDGSHTWVLYAQGWQPERLAEQSRQLLRNAKRPEKEVYPSGKNIRLPFGYHQRTKTRGRLLLQTGDVFDLDNPDQLHAAMVAVSDLPRNTTPPPPLRPAGSSASGPIASDYEELAAALDALSPSRVAEYEDWSRVCFALKNTGVSDDEGLRLFHEVSKKANYDAVEVDKLWRRTGDKNRQGQRLTIASIYKWANEDAPGWRDRFYPQPEFNDDGYAVCCETPVIASKYGGGWCPHCKTGYKKLTASQMAPARAPEQARDDQAASGAAAPDEEPRRSRFNLETLDDLAQLPPTEWLIPERIPADSLTLLYGPSESGKSFIALHWALTIALRNPDRAVIYVAPEGGSGYQKRAAAWLQHWKKQAPRNLLFIRAAPRLGDASDLRELIDTITPYQPLFVALDTLARCAVELDENSAKDMGLFIEACDKIRRATGAAVMPVHHSGKDARNGARGSSALRAAVDMAHEVQRDGELVTLACDKSKDIAKPDSIYLHMMEVAESVVLMPSDKIITTRNSKLQANERAVLEALALEVFAKVGASARKLVEVSGVPEGSLYRVLSKLLKRGYVTQAQKGDPYYISDTGRRAITDYQESINSGASWGPDDDPPEGPPPPPRGGDSSDSESDSSEPELSPEYGSTKPNYHTITGYDGAEVIEPAPESDELSPDYHNDTASESPTITTITDYHPTIDSDTSSLSSHHGYIYDSRDGESAAEKESDSSIATKPPEPSASGAAPEPPEGWQIVRCDHRGNVTRFGAYWRAVHTSGEMTEPTQYPDSAARLAWAAQARE